MSNNSFLVVADYDLLLDLENETKYINMIEYFTICNYLGYNAIFYNSYRQLFTTLCWYFQTEERDSKPVTFEIIGIDYKKIKRVIKEIKYAMQIISRNKNITIIPLTPFESCNYRKMIDLTPLFESEEK